jgi:hypothetical protein
VAKVICSILTDGNLITNKHLNFQSAAIKTIDQNEFAEKYK